MSFNSVIPKSMDKELTQQMKSLEEVCWGIQDYQSGVRTFGASDGL